jgi:hypothetical protein
MNNNNKSNNKSSGGIGVLSLLQVAFIILKLCGVINWSWGAVLIPLWLDIGLLVLIFLICLWHR